MKMEITATGNAGFKLISGNTHIFIDAFYEGAIPGVAEAPIITPAEVDRADIILVTHAHRDHFKPEIVADAARRTGAMVGGPAPVINSLRSMLSEQNLTELAPESTESAGAPPFIETSLRGIRIRTFRTFHALHHNSYLVETPDFRFFHDGDNENTQKIKITEQLDALFIGPWRGSGWVEFIERIKPNHYFLMHLTNEELDELEAGKFLPEICDHVPPGLIAPRAGQTFIITKK